MQLETAIKRFTRNQKSLNRAPATIQWYRTLLRRFSEYMNSSHGITTVAGIDSKTLLSYQYKISQSRNIHGKPFAVAVQNLHLIVLRSLFNYLIRTGSVKYDPTEDIDLAREPDVLPSDVLSVAEMFQLLDQPDAETFVGLRDRCIMELMYSTGMRSMEVLGLNLGDIYMENANIFIRRAKGSKNRVVPFGSIAKKCLRTYLPKRRKMITQDEGRLAEGPYRRLAPKGKRHGKVVQQHRTNAVFLSAATGRRMNKQMLGRIIHAYAKQANILKNVTPHVFRHACATHLLDNGASVLHIQKLLGHSRIETTTRYLRISITSLKRVHSQYHPLEVAAAK